MSAACWLLALLLAPVCQGIVVVIGCFCISVLAIRRHDMTTADWVFASILAPVWLVVGLAVVLGVMRA